jgi:putative ABC transport system permease protein
LLTNVLRRTIAEIDPELAVSNVQTMQQIERASVGNRRFQLTLVTAFAASSLIVAALGIYGVLAYAVSARTHELAMRMALGAQSSRIVALVIRQGMQPVLFGLVFGIVLALAFGRAISSLLYAVTPTDLSTITTVVMLTLIVAFVASLLPARRAVGTSVLAALRYD